MYYRFGKAFYYLSILAFIFFLLYFYSALPDQVGVGFDSNGDLARTWSRDAFFYGMIGGFIILNFVVLFPPKSLETKSNKKLHRIFPVGDSYRDYFLTWFYSFGGILNLSLGLLVFYIHSINNQEVIAASEFNFWFYLMPVLLLVWVVGLFLLFIGKFKSVQRS
ncbi:hypothetical protein DFQ04_0927 [Algoriphagus boseongensis]|uniref:DNA topoisomerase IV subunit B n=1 Tax=Algoriphagus boseongensis TaxID=1442587 RepID=A0A4R6T7V2_9BACT|nr:DNA topoisomerase IV [Algoriphagus boseongensis]TDQ19110.1 hypothetical protein DFQ04_0927 [Algoriphagus boseongensis]